MAKILCGMTLKLILAKSVFRKLNPKSTTMYFFFVLSILFCIDQNGQVKSQIYGEEKMQSETCGRQTIIKNDLRTLAPWSAPIFRRHRHSNNNRTQPPPTFYTNGIVIGPSLILSVRGGPLGSRDVGSPRDLFVAAGINSSDFSTHDAHAQYSRISLIEPFRHHDVVNIYFHYVLYHLKQPLDFSTPYVREICIPFYYTRKNLDWRIVNPWGWPTVQVGFGRPLPSPSPAAAVAAAATVGTTNLRKNNHPEEKKPVIWTLKVWEMITGPKKICESAFRFFYRRNLPYFCTKRISDQDKAGLDTAYPRVFHSFDELSDRQSNPKGQEGQAMNDNEEETMCQGHGSANTYAYGQIWYLFSFVTMIPGKRRARCDANTVYGHTFSNPATYLQLLVWLFRSYKCGGNQFWCEDSLLCRPISDVCNGIYDCPNESDEHEVTCRHRHRLLAKNLTNNGDLIDSQESNKNKFNLTLTLPIDPRDSVSGKCPDLIDLAEGAAGTICKDAVTNETVNCKTTTFIGAQLRVECDDWHTAPHFSYQFLTLFCDQNGEWQGMRPFHCEPECGIMEKETGTDDEGNPALAAYYTGFPWHATIFDEKNHRRPLCGSTLIEQKFLLTSAKCLKNWQGAEESRSSFTIFIRPVSSNFEENVASPSSQEFGIKNVWFSNGTNFNGDSNGVAENLGQISIIELETPVQINAKNKPMTVCYLLQNQFNGLLQTETRQTQISGMTTTKNDENGGKIIANLTLIPNEQCGLSSSDLNHFCVSSKFEEKENGNGFFVASTQEKSLGAQQKTVYNLKGILIGQSSPKNEEGGHSIFVNVDIFSNWILDTLERHSR